MTHTAMILGLRGPSLDRDTAAFFAAARPWGVILFGGCFVSPDQARRLCDDVQVATGGTLIFVDQEGGKVQRLKPPHWPAYPSAARYGRLFDLDEDAALEATLLGHRLIAHDLYELGIRADCAPCLDIPIRGASDVIGSRAFHPDPIRATHLAAMAIQGLHEGGVASVIKHLPGHGRALVDSHLQLPVVRAPRKSLSRDLSAFKPFVDIAPMAMTCHVVFPTWDEDAPTTLSAKVISEVIRGEIGFQGLLMTDDLGMKALSDDWWRKADRLFAAGCDIGLECSGDLATMEEFAAAVPTLSGQRLARAQAVEQWLVDNQPYELDVEGARERLADLMAHVP